MIEFKISKEIEMYSEIIERKKITLFTKRLLDIIVALSLLVILCIPMLIIAIIIKLDSEGPVFYKQERVTKNGKIFGIYKFRTMITNADKLGTLVTVGEDNRITKCGKFLRKYRLDELPQLFNIISGDMTLVGTRPEVPSYVAHYSDEMLATLLLPAGVTSLASIKYKDEAMLLEKSKNPDETYIKEVLPEKMKYNIEYLKVFSISTDIKILLKTVLAVIGVNE